LLWLTDTVICLKHSSSIAECAPLLSIIYPLIESRRFV
jgi:hypothetical protein